MVDYSLISRRKGNILDIKVTGKRSFEAAAALMEEVFQRTQEYQSTLLLVDVWQFTGRLGVADTYRMVTGSFPEFRKQGLEKVAVIDTRPDKKSGWFFETVAQNRGYELRFFEERSEAEAWLQGE